MRYRADVKDVAYCYDGSYQGFLCCIFESFTHHEIPTAVLPPEEGQLSLFGSKTILTDEAKAKRVAAGLDRLGMLVANRVTTGFLSTESGKDLALLRFARFCFERGPGAAGMLGDPDVSAAFAVERAVNNEAHSLIEFIRFEQRGAMLGAVIHPKHRVLPLLRAHFSNRLPDENFLIFDATHGMAMLRQGGVVQYLAMERWNPEKDETELDWQALWKGFFDALTIKERLNPKCQMLHVSKRFWPDMCEMQPAKKPLPGAVPANYYGPAAPPAEKVPPQGGKALPRVL